MGQPVVEAVWATIHQPAAGQEFCAVDLVIAPSAVVGAQLEIMTIAVHLGQVIDEMRLVPLLRQQQSPTRLDRWREQAIGVNRAS